MVASPPLSLHETQYLRIEDILISGGTQYRARMNREVIDEYADAIREGTKLPPVLVFYDGTSYWLADGFHRLHAAQKAQEEDVAAEIETEIRNVGRSRIGR